MIYNNMSHMLSKFIIHYHIASHCVVSYHSITIVLNCTLLIVLAHTFLCSIVSYRLHPLPICIVRMACDGGTLSR